MIARPLPSDVSAERALLGAAMQWPDRVLAEVGGLGLRAWHFYRPEHQQLFGLLVEMERNGESIDLVTVPSKIARSGRAADYGGIDDFRRSRDEIGDRIRFVAGYIERRTK